MLSKMLLETWNIVRNNGGKRRKKLTIYDFYLNRKREKTESSVFVVVVGMTVFKTRRNTSESRDNFGPSALVKRAKEELAKEEEVKTAAFTSFPSSWTGRPRASPSSRDSTGFRRTWSRTISWLLPV